MHIEFIQNPDTGVLEAWEDGRVIGEFIPTGIVVKRWKLTDCIVRKEEGLCLESAEQLICPVRIEMRVYAG